ncbi:MAG: hypothetical protein ACP5JB_07770 [candidate division WOR-3 bacterium]|jgi:hypothetical protein
MKLLSAMLIFPLLIIAGYGSKDDNRKTQFNLEDSTDVRVEMSHDFLLTLPAVFRYPNAEEIDMSGESSERYVECQYILRTSDHFPEVVRFYEQAYDNPETIFGDTASDEFCWEGGRSISDEVVTLTAKDEQELDCWKCIIVRESDGTLMLLINRRELSQRDSR